MARSETIDESIAFYTDTKHYQPFDCVDGRVRESCIDPRDVEGPLTVDYQTGGGVIGRGLDRALTSWALKPETGIRTIEEAVLKESFASDGCIKEGAHFNGCKLARGIMPVLAEIADPSEETVTAYERWSEMHLEASDPREWQQCVALGAQALYAYWEAAGVSEDPEQKADDLVDIVDWLNEDDDVVRVKTMVGPNKAGFYIINHVANYGLRRDLVLRGERPVADTAYHDNLGETVTLKEYSSGNSEELLTRSTATMLRSAATRTIVAPRSGDVSYLEVMRYDRSNTVGEIIAV